MGKIPDELRATIARNIRACRMKKYPGRGGGKNCAAGFSEYIGKNVSPQQWSPWETGKRIPDEVRLKQIADFFGVTVEDLRRDKQSPPAKPSLLAQDISSGDLGDTRMFKPIPGIDVPPPPGWQPDTPGSPASFFWLARHFLALLQSHGLRIDKQCLDYLANAMRRPPH